MQRYRCAHCNVEEQACSYLLLDLPLQALCMKAKGWRRSRASARNWCCLSCRATQFPDDMSLPQADTLMQFCVGHLQLTQESLYGGVYTGDYYGRSSASSGPWAPPPPPPPPPQPQPPNAAWHQCRDKSCQASFRRCSSCLTLETQYKLQLQVMDMAQQSQLGQQVITLSCNLNTTPMTAFPTWVLNPTMGEARQVQHVAENLWDDCGNLAGSTLMLILLRPLVFGLPWLAPLHIFGTPPPVPLLDLDGVAPAARPHDNHRTNCLEGLLGHFRQVGDHDRGDLLQDCWYLMKLTIVQQQWDNLPAWQITRRSLNLNPVPSLMPALPTPRQ